MLLFLLVLAYCNLVYSYSVTDFTFNADKICQQVHNEKDDKGYAYFEEKMDFIDSYFFCKKKDMELLKIASSDEISNVAKWIKGYFNADKKLAFWISAKRRSLSTKLKEFVQVSDYSPVILNDWYTNSNQPDNQGGTQNCLTLSNYHSGKLFKLFDESCIEKRSFICQSYCDRNPPQHNRHGNDTWKWLEISNFKP